MTILAVAESLMKMLDLAGHDVKIALDGPTALEEFSTFQPEFVVLDIGLPGMDGYEVARHIRNATTARPVTSSPSPATARRKIGTARVRPASITT